MHKSNKVKDNCAPIPRTGKIKVKVNKPPARVSQRMQQARMEGAVQTKKVQYPNYVDTKDEKEIDCRIIHVGPRTKYTLPCPEKFDVVYTANEAIIMLKPYFKQCGSSFWLLL